MKKFLIQLLLFVSVVSSSNAYYQAEQGRWLNRDPVGESGENNLYGFVGNNGIQWVDYIGWFAMPEGMTDEDVCGCFSFTVTFNKDRWWKDYTFEPLVDDNIGVDVDLVTLHGAWKGDLTEDCNCLKKELGDDPVGNQLFSLLVLHEPRGDDKREIIMVHQGNALTDYAAANSFTNKRMVESTPERPATSRGIDSGSGLGFVGQTFELKVVMKRYGKKGTECWKKTLNIKEHMDYSKY